MGFLVSAGGKAGCHEEVGLRSKWASEGLREWNFPWKSALLPSVELLSNYFPVTREIRGPISPTLMDVG